MVPFLTTPIPGPGAQTVLPMPFWLLDPLGQLFYRQMLHSGFLAQWNQNFAAVSRGWLSLSISV